jgi:hypothetical protein
MIITAPPTLLAMIMITLGVKKALNFSAVLLPVVALEESASWVGEGDRVLVGMGTAATPGVVFDGEAAVAAGGGVGAGGGGVAAAGAGVGDSVEEGFKVVAGSSFFGSSFFGSGVGEGFGSSFFDSGEGEGLGSSFGDVGSGFLSSFVGSGFEVGFGLSSH